MPKAWRAYETSDSGFPLRKVFEKFIKRVVVLGIQSRHVPCSHLSELCPYSFPAIVHLTCQESADVLNGDSRIGTQRGVRIHWHGFGFLRLLRSRSRGRSRGRSRSRSRSCLLDVSCLYCYRICSNNLTDLADHLEILFLFEVCLELNFDFHWLDDF
nr:MAG TPA: hypothetical protein [Caudoviricetes sp.]